MEDAACNGVEDSRTALQAIIPHIRVRDGYKAPQLRSHPRTSSHAVTLIPFRTDLFYPFP